MLKKQNYHTQSAKDVIKNLGSNQEHGLSKEQVKDRLHEHGPNSIPESKPPGILTIFFSQFKSPLIYILVIAALVSVVLQEHMDAIFISAVLIINAIIGTIQEFSAEKAAHALKKLAVTHCRVIRDKEHYKINSEGLVPGDIVLLESGDKVPADIRLIKSHNLKVDESLLTGESLPSKKFADNILAPDAIINDRCNMLFAGTVVTNGRGRGIVVNTAMNTQIGTIAHSILEGPTAKSPLIKRMEKFTNKIAVAVVIIAMLIAIVAFYRNVPLNEIFMLTVALAVSAIPEGLPVAITVALAICMHRMAKRHVIVRQLVAVEALGSCTYIATDKTGTLTQNKLEAQKIFFPDGEIINLTEDDVRPSILTKRFYQSIVLANEASLSIQNENLVHHGDPTDVALLIMAYKQGIIRKTLLAEYPELITIPFESTDRMSASLNQNLTSKNQTISIKGAVEKVLPLCNKMATLHGDIELDSLIIEEQAQELAEQGYRVIAVAGLETSKDYSNKFTIDKLQNLCFLGLIGLIDPLRKEAKSAIKACQNAGIKVAMITGDHPITAATIAKQIELNGSYDHIVTGSMLHKATTKSQKDSLINSANVFARIEPTQKLDIVKSLQTSGHFLAVSGDGANDAPALRAAEVGVAMGKNGTELAKESAKLIITDDNFASIVAGIEEGRIAYANIRKVIFLLLSTGLAELILFILALIYNLPLPLFAVQLLWLNLVTNGIQDVALAFEPKEGGEMYKPPRPPKEPIFNKIMLERIIISALVMGFFAFYIFKYFINLGLEVDSARNITLLLMVLFENIHVLNSRSETRSVFRHNLFKNKLLIIGTISAQLIHIAAMYTPGLNTVLRIQPVSVSQWIELLIIALMLLIIMELHKYFRNHVVKY